MYGKQLPSMSVKKTAILGLATLLAPLLLMSFIFDKCDIWRYGIPLYAMLTIGISFFVAAFQKESNSITSIFRFLGKYATNIYIVHLMLSKYWYSDLFYSIQSPCIIFLTLLMSSLLLSIIIGYAKECTGYNKMFDYIVKKIVK